jgi:hypothetical protein
VYVRYSFWSLHKGLDTAFRGVFSFIFALASCGVLLDPMQLSGELAALFHIVSWIIFVFVRYYFSPYDWSFFTRAVAGMVQGALLIILIACFYSFPRESLIEAASWAAGSVWVFLVHLNELAYGHGHGR